MAKAVIAVAAAIAVALYIAWIVHEAKNAPTVDGSDV